MITDFLTKQFRLYKEFGFFVNIINFDVDNEKKYYYNICKDGEQIFCSLDEGLYYDNILTCQIKLCNYLNRYLITCEYFND